MVIGDRDEVRDHPQVTLAAAKRAVCLVAQVFRDRGDGIRLLDGELGERVVRGILPDQRDVRAVQRRDDFQLQPFMREHLFGETAVTASKFSIEQSDAVTAVSEYLRDETYRAFGCGQCD